MINSDIGIAVTPERARSKGIEEVLDNIAEITRAGGLATSPYVAFLAPTGTGARETLSNDGLG